MDLSPLKFLGMDWKELGIREKEGSSFVERVNSVDGDAYYNRHITKFIYELDDCEMLLRLVHRELEARARTRARK